MAILLLRIVTTMEEIVSVSLLLKVPWTLLKLLVKHGANIHNMDTKGRIPLMEAALWARAEVVDYHLSHGSDPCHMDSKRKDRKSHRVLDFFRNK